MLDLESLFVPQLMQTMATDTRANFNYTVDTGVSPEIYFYDTPLSAGLRTAGDDPHEMAIRDGWSQASSFSLDREGFALRDFSSPFDRWDDDAAIHSEFYGSVTEYVRQTVGAKRVEIFDHTIRTKANAQQQTTEQNTTQRAPVMLVHCDYTPISGPLRVRQVLPGEADDLLKRRVAFFNFWKPLRRRVDEKPVAMCSVTTSVPDDFITLKMHYREREGEIYVVRHAPKHQWWYFPHMTTDHALLLKTYDSETDGRARFLAHSAFEHPDTPADVAPRESIEIRTIAFF